MNLDYYRLWYSFRFLFEETTVEGKDENPIVRETETHHQRFGKIPYPEAPNQTKRDDFLRSEIPRNCPEFTPRLRHSPDEHCPLPHRRQELTVGGEKEVHAHGLVAVSPAWPSVPVVDVRDSRDTW